MTQDELVAALSEILNGILSARDLAQQELLRADELSRLSENTGKRLNSLKPSFSDEWQRKYEKITHNRWKSVLRGGFANIKTYDEHIGYFEEFTRNLITHLLLGA
ncbi:hypothetical protein L0337_27670 [candidate division KSB1 bacterium]|nr:hypothetical protein [candidate division KSB1 bacterium]